MSLFDLLRVCIRFFILLLDLFNSGCCQFMTIDAFEQYLARKSAALPASGSALMVSSDLLYFVNNPVLSEAFWQFHQSLPKADNSVLAIGFLLRQGPAWRCSVTRPVRLAGFGRCIWICSDSVCAVVLPGPGDILKDRLAFFRG